MSSLKRNSRKGLPVPQTVSFFSPRAWLRVLCVSVLEVRANFQVVVVSLSV